MPSILRSRLVPSGFNAILWTAVTSSVSIDRKAAISAGTKIVIPVFVAPGNARMKAQDIAGDDFWQMKQACFAQVFLSQGPARVDAWFQISTARAIRWRSSAVNSRGFS